MAENQAVQAIVDGLANLMSVIVTLQSGSGVQMTLPS